MNKLSPEAWLALPQGSATPPEGRPADRAAGDPWHSLLFVVFKWLPQMAAIVAIGIVLGLGYLILVRGEIFQANAKLYVRVGVDQTPSPVLGSDRNVTYLAQTRGAVQSEMDLLRNEVLVQRLIQELDLTAPEVRPEPKGLFGRLKRTASDIYRSAKDMLDGVLTAVGLKTPVSPEAAISQGFAGALILDNAVNSDVISVSLRWPDQAQAVVLLDHFLKIYTNFRSAVFQGGEEIEFLDAKRDTAKAAVEAVEADMAAFEREHDIRNAAARAPLLEADLVEAQRAQERAALELNLARRRLERLGKGLDAAAEKGAPIQREPIGLGSFPANSPALGMAASIVTLLGERERLLVNNSAGAPEVKEVEARLAALMVVLRQQLEAEVQDFVRGETVARERVEKLGGALRELQASSNGWKTLERRRDLAESRYRDTEKRLGEARDISALRNARLSNVVVVQPAAVEGVPIGLRKMPLLGIIAFCSAVLAAGWALGREVFDTRLYRGETAAADLGLPLAGEIPERRLLLREWVRGDGRRGREAGLALDRLVVTVDERLKADRRGVLAVAGAEPGEGASTLALALALGIAARRRQKVLLVSGSADPAFLDRVRGSGLPAMPLPTPEGLPAGLTLAAVGEYLVCGTWADASSAAAFLREGVGPGARLRAEAPLVVVDLPPLSGDAEAPFAGGQADAALLVAAAGRHRAAIHREALDALHRHGAELVGLVLNRTRRIVPCWLEPGR